MSLNKQYGVGLLLTVAATSLINLSPLWAVVVGVSAIITLGGVLYRVL
jgi:hypothetical protein